MYFRYFLKDFILPRILFLIKLTFLFLFPVVITIGVVAGSLAAATQASIGNIVAGSAFAGFQALGVYIRTAFCMLLY
jgi:hypothetical protein